MLTLLPPHPTAATGLGYGVAQTLDRAALVAGEVQEGVQARTMSAVEGATEGLQYTGETVRERVDDVRQGVSEGGQQLRDNLSQAAKDAQDMLWGGDAGR